MSCYGVDSPSLFSLSGYPGQDDNAPIRPSPIPEGVADNLVALEDWLNKERARIAALEAARALRAPRTRFSVAPGTKMSVDASGHKSGGAASPCIPAKSYAVPSSKLPPYKGHMTMPIAPCPPTRPPTPHPCPSLRPTLDVRALPFIPARSFCPSPVPSSLSSSSSQYWFTGEPAKDPFCDTPGVRSPELQSSLARARAATTRTSPSAPMSSVAARAFPAPDSTGNSLALTKYVPPALREKEPTRTFYPTLIEGVFDTEPPSEWRTAEFMAERIADNCLSIAMSPDELATRLMFLDDDAKLEVFKITRLLRLDASRCNSRKIVRIRRCAVHIYGLDFECEVYGGGMQWLRDVNLRMDPAAQKLIYEFWENSSRTLSVEQIKMLRELPQYAYGEGDRIFNPMLRRAVSEAVVPARTYL